MAVDDLSKYGIKYPGLCLEIWNFFNDSTIQSMFYKNLRQMMGDGVGAKNTKSSLDFSTKFGSKYKDPDDDSIMIQPRVVSKICDILCENNMLSKMHIGGFNLSDGESFYFGFAEKQIHINVSNQRYFNNIVYGFKYLYEANKINVLPVYPNHSGFGNFLTATTGQIAAIEKSYLCPAYELMLLTGKIKGGNSGGPVLDKQGNVIGIITETADPQGDYDKFGYGMAIPSVYIKKILYHAEEFTEKINFVDNI